MWMARTLTLMFRRDPSKDRLEEKIPFEGYNILWPDGTAAELAIDALCKHGQRLLGLGKYLQGCNEKMIDMITERHPLKKFLNPEEVADMTEFLVSPRSASISGQVFKMDCGIVSFKI